MSQTYERNDKTIELSALIFFRVPRGRSRMSGEGRGGEGVTEWVQFELFARRNILPSPPFFVPFRLAGARLIRVMIPVVFARPSKQLL